MSGLIPQHFIDDLIARADIVDVVGKRIPLRKAGREYKAVCPFHDEKTPSFTVSPTKGFYHCFGCGAHGTALGFLMEYEHLSFPEAVEALAHSMGLEVPRDESQRPAHRHDELYGLMQEVQMHFEARLKAHPPALQYLESRGVDAATAARYGLGYAPPGWSELLDRFGKSPDAIQRLVDAGLVIRRENKGTHYDRFRGRLMFPIRDSRGRVIGFGGRIMGDGEPKYLNSPETVLFHKGRELYGLYEARQALRNIEKLVVVEGYMDVIGLARHGIEFAAATLGTATTEEHLNRLFRLCDDVLFCFDADRAGRAAAWRALETALPQVREGRQIRFVFLPEGQDPDSFVQQMGAPAFEAELDRGITLSEFLIEEVSDEIDLDTVEGRARLTEKVRPLVRRMSEGDYRDFLLDGLAQKVGLSIPKIEEMLARDNAPAAQMPRTAFGRRIGPAKRGGSTGPRSLEERTLALVVHYPTAAMNLDIERLAGIDRPLINRLRDLIEMVQARPDITTAGLLERWRNREDGAELSSLVCLELPSDEFDPAAELDGCIRQLETRALRYLNRVVIQGLREKPASEVPSELKQRLSARGASKTKG